jgi:hypothetical protein
MNLIRIKTSPFALEVVLITLFSLLIFWFAQTHDAFEYLVEMTREHEEMEA